MSNTYISSSRYKVFLFAIGSTESDDQAVGSSEPESGSADGGMPASSTEGKFLNGSMEGPVAASSTEGVSDKSHPETSTADGNALTSSSDQRQVSVSGI